MRRSIRTRLIITLIILAVVPLLSVGAILSWQGFSTQRDQVLSVQHQVALRASVQVSDLFQELENELQLAIRIKGFKGLTTDQQKSALSQLLAYRNAFDRIFLLDSNGQELVGAARGGVITTSDLVSRAQNDEFVTPFADRKVYFSQVHVDQVTGQPVITIAIPIVDLQSNTVENVLVADLRFKNVQDLVASMETTPQGVIYVVDSQNKVVVHRDPSVSLKDTHFTPPSTDGIYTGLSGASAVIATDTITLGKQTLVVVAEAPVSEALALAVNTVVITSILIVIALVIASSIGLLVVRRLVRPIQALAVSAQAIRLGDFSKQTPVIGQDEVGQLAQAFNDMVVAIQKREKELRDQADELRIATAKAREASRVKGEFMANISHELRTPLNAIIGFSDMLLMGIGGELNENQQHKITRLRENGMRLLSLINNVLDLTRIESRRIELAQKPFGPRALVERVTSQMEVLANQKQLELKTHLSADLPVILIGDEQRIEQVIVNLLANAFKFTAKGSITVNVGTNRAEKTWKIDVTDTGTGIPPHALDLIFEEFRQLDSSSSRSFKGSGLGLTIARNLVRVMDGQIAVKSDIGVGSTFTVTLPILAEAQIAEPISNKEGV